MYAMLCQVLLFGVRGRLVHQVLSFEATQPCPWWQMSLALLLLALAYILMFRGAPCGWLTNSGGLHFLCVMASPKSIV